MVSGGQILTTFSWWPPPPRSDAALERGAPDRRRRAPGRASRSSRSATISMPMNRPRPRISPTCGSSASAARSRSSSARAERRRPLRRGRSSRRTPIAARPGGEVDGVAHERRGVRAGRPVAHERGAPDDRRHGQPAADALADGHQVRDDAPVLGRPGPAGPPEPALDLVEDEDDAVAIAQLAQPGEEAVGRDDDAAVALDRLDDDRRDAARSRTPGPRARGGRARARRSPAVVVRAPSGQRYGYG